jgi:hypothetical protein
MYTAGFTITRAPYHCHRLMALARQHGIKGYMKYLGEWHFYFQVSNPATSLLQLPGPPAGLSDLLDQAR